MDTKQIRLGVAGLGLAGAFMIRAAVIHPGFKLVAGMDPAAAPREAFARDFGAATYSNFDDLCADPNIDAIYIASPHRFHASQAVEALDSGKHVLVEKPLGLRLDDCDLVIAAAARTGRVLIVGHSHAFDPNIRKMRDIIQAGDLGRVVMLLAFNYTDYIYRPHGPDELRREHGGGVVFNQVAHQIEVARLLVGQRVTALRAQLNNLDTDLPIDGASMALVEFEGGATASLVYNGYGYFDSDEFHQNIGEGGTPKIGGHTFLRRKGAQHYNDGAIGGLAYGARALPVAQPFLPHFGVVVLTCERGDIRLSADGVLIHGVDGTRKVAVRKGIGRPGQGDALDALWAAVFEGRSCIHDAAWGRATVAALLAIEKSAATASRIELG